MRWLVCSSALCFSLAAGPAQAVQYFSAPVEIPNDGGWTNYVRLANLDADADFELLVPSCAGLFTPPVAEAFRVYDYQGGAFVDITVAALGEAPTLAVRVVAVGDVDDDGDLDVFAPSADGALDRLYINDGAGVFANEAAARLPATANASRSAAARFGDVDGDGDLDLLVGQGYPVGVPDTPPATLLINDGSGVFTDATANLPQTFPGVDPDDIDFADIDRDFDLDVLVNAHNGKSALWKNDGSGVFTDVSAGMPGPSGGQNHYGPSTCDVDGDGDLDIVVDNIGGAPLREQLLLNDGTGVFTDATDQLGANSSADDNGVMCIDVDDDGDFDLAIPSLSANERILINDGAGNFTLEVGGFPNRNDPSLWMDFADLNADGRPDAVTGNGEGSPDLTVVYFGSPEMPVDATAPHIAAFELPEASGGPVRFAVRDRIVTDSGPRVRAFARVDSAEIDASFMGGDLFRVVLPAPSGSMATAALCAVDASGNEGCVDVPYGSGGAGGSGGDGAGGSAGPGGPGNGGAGPGGSGAGASLGADDEDGGCGCRMVSQRSAGELWALVLLGAGIVVRRQRRL